MVNKIYRLRFAFQLTSTFGKYSFDAKELAGLFTLRLLRLPKSAKEVTVQRKFPPSVKISQLLDNVDFNTYIGSFD